MITLYQSHPEFALYAVIPVWVGLAFLIYYFTVGRKHAQEIEARRRAEPAAAGGMALGR